MSWLALEPFQASARRILLSKIPPESACLMAPCSPQVECEYEQEQDVETMVMAEVELVVPPRTAMPAVWQITELNRGSPFRSLRPLKNFTLPRLPTVNFPLTTITSPNIGTAITETSGQPRLKNVIMVAVMDGGVAIGLSLQEAATIRRVLHAQNAPRAPSCYSGIHLIVGTADGTVYESSPGLEARRLMEATLDPRLCLRLFNSEVWFENPDVRRLGQALDLTNKTKKDQLAQYIK
jgi:hypothetical protein